MGVGLDTFFRVVVDRTERRKGSEPDLDLVPRRRPKIPAVDADVQALTVSRHTPMRVSEQLHDTVMRSHPGPPCVMIEHHPRAVFKLREGTMGGRLHPRQRQGRFLVVVADDQALPPVQPPVQLQDAGRVGPVCEIAEVPDIVLRADDLVPVRNHRLVHLLDGPKGRCSIPMIASCPKWVSAVKKVVTLPSGT